ncbi:hypothetical protein SAMN05421806_105429 [Streptomyces indicus]|uniref:Uncharacterized protein n=1 Tax=Streptomyces indicus TaxID=417292 RepID=A0A1G9AAQ6_9ACTN|nr:hypothetical protein SAMN05421806_105429 [Streptomyces indicus]
MWGEAAGPFLSYRAVPPELETLPKLLSDSIEGTGVAMQASHKGYEHIDVDLRDRMRAISAEATEQYGGSYEAERVGMGHGGGAVPDGVGGDTSGGSGF